MKIISLLLLLFFMSYSNDCMIDMQGGNIFIDKSNNIQMVKERIKIDMELRSAKVSCKFWLYNSKGTTSKIVGFPNGTDIESRLFGDFKTKMNGKWVSVNKRFQKTFEVRNGDTSLTDIKEWYYWGVYFPANDTVIIENFYSAEYGGCAYFSPSNLNYIIGTGLS